ncbi:hypothetical protein ASPWEDRAFT_38077 [Aspergillus wentii DTO 134E9]|uniref:Palmitoyl-protein thioesterase 1 n=1 Tax=Aspergillus wentii DTO 134E9 TaxID=1073089 RepID=A0A1L9RNH0_ASPWE|nr:uncharacterized protein ASPWEDRAFT_38077 [Aspergillus wentii DTO 134E9]KAI9934361.1 hypothetical protein MW887_005438 [Aspergillus wentii]OJJ36495.1 hypothetical protein ASPWEDRAFT_38077 [Aspergillus wentii DTO 134E9]
MRSSTALPLLLPLAVFSAAHPSLRNTNNNDNPSTPPPLVIWHGLGDESDSDGMQYVTDLVQKVNPGTYVHRIRLGDTAADDRKESFMGNVTEQVATVCEQLASDPNISNAPSINAMGFSQGGQFLRAYVQRCNSPPVRNLVTFGSQHNGISQFQTCGPGDWLCKAANALLYSGRWTKVVQSQLVPAQYFRDAADLDDYLAYSNFLADINNEREEKNPTYRDNLASLNRFVMFMFDDDHIAHPKESSWFADYNSSSEELTPLRERDLYKEDWLGLKILDEQDKLHFKTTPGAHMHLTEEVLNETFKEYFGPVEDTEADATNHVLIKQGGH